MQRMHCITIANGIKNDMARRKNVRGIFFPAIWIDGSVPNPIIARNNSLFLNIFILVSNEGSCTNEGTTEWLSEAISLPKLIKIN